MYFSQDEAPANAVHDICIWYMIKCQHVRWNTTDLPYGIDSSKKMFNSGKRKYWLRIISLERTFHVLWARSHLKGLSQAACCGLQCGGAKEGNRKHKKTWTWVQCWMLSPIWTEQYGKKTGKRRKFEEYKPLYEPKCKNKLHYFFLNCRPQRRWEFAWQTPSIRRIDIVKIFCHLFY